MTSLRRAVISGFFVWLIPFATSFAVFPLKASWRSLFESIMPVVLAGTVVVLAVRYLRRAESRTIAEGVKLGILWLLISVVIDLPLMLGPPMNYPLNEYAADIGLTYLMIPIITTGIAAAGRPALF